MRKLFIIAILFNASLALATGLFDGEYRDGKFLGERAVFQLSIHQSGTAIEIGFDAVHNDGYGAAPDGTGAGKVNGNRVQFSWKDSFGNTGTGTITLADCDAVVSMKSLHMADPRCVVFYRENMRLKRVK